MNSRTWRLGRPLRWAGSVARKGRMIAEAPAHALSYYGSAGVVLSKALRVLRHEGVSGLMCKAEVLSKVRRQNRSGGALSGVAADQLYGPMPALCDEYVPLVSVIVPNLNHAPYLRRRLDSIYGQTYRNFEVILLDDASGDDSVEVLKEYAARYESITITAFNTTNSGGVFNQWKKGLSLAKGDLVWIAESDDYCGENHLTELVRFFQNEAVMLAFCRSDFVRDDTGDKIWTSEEYLADTQQDLWRQPFIKSAHWLVNNAWGMKNIVPNVSSAVFRHPGEMALLNSEAWRALRLCGDWVFYLNLVRGGLVAYSPWTTNCYRQHAQGTSVNTQKEDAYYREHEFVATSIQELYRVDPSILERQRHALYLHWCLSRGSTSEDAFNHLYRLDRACAAAAHRPPNVLMAAYALAAGGGETFPIVLANQLRRRGSSVSFLNCKLATTEPGVRSMLDRGIPLLELEAIGLITDVCDDMGIEIVHSHHAWVDMTLAQCLERRPGVRQVITMHGMYEMMPSTQVEGLLPLLERRIDRVVYTADKNLLPFTQEFRSRKGFVRIDNALEAKPIHPVERESLGIKSEDFVLCLVSRAIPEKGWEEAINAVELAQEKCPRRLQLLLIGEGPEFDRLRGAYQHEFVHFLGFKANIRDYFAMADAGFLPSRFKGESFPLVLIDCLFAGKPMLASRVGEIPEMLKSDAGLAGELFVLQDGLIPVEELSRLIVRLAIDEPYYRSLANRVAGAAAKFDSSLMMDKYTDVYRSILCAH